jgi:hypothetical protein
VSTRDDDAAWREIVDNYGERPVVPPHGGPGADVGPDVGTDSPDAGAEWLPADPGTETYRVTPAPLEPDDSFVPPPLPPPPDIAPDRRFAWVGLVTPPLLLVVAGLVYPLPGLVNGLLVLMFLGSFAYLVATMSREPRDPDDDGARL